MRGPAGLLRPAGAHRAAAACGAGRAAAACGVGRAAAGCRGRPGRYGV